MSQETFVGIQALVMTFAVIYLLKWAVPRWIDERMQIKEAKRRLEEVRKRQQFERADYYAVVDD